jgi:crotonobetainyl-CoA:carnitine CoA-transferase CaiB-like acyl-CoA transferase
MTGRIPTRDGNHHPDMAPHGCYPCKDAEWISIAVQTEEQWHALCIAMEQASLAQDPRYADLRSRQANALELDNTVSAWTCRQVASELSVELQVRGVAAFKSLNSIDLVSNEHLWRRQFYRHVTDDKQRSVPIVGAPWRMSVTPTSIERAAPRLGEHNDYVLGTLLGLSAEEQQRLVAEKIVY